MKFKKGELNQDSFSVIMHDLMCLQLKDTDDNTYHYNLLKQNLKDLWGYDVCAKCKKKKTIDFEDIGLGQYCQKCLDEENKNWEEESGFGDDEE